MANFKTHVVVATAVSGVASVTWLTLQLATPWSTGGYFLLGVLGGLLPDIDSDKSAPLNMIFFLLSMYCAFAFVFNLAMQYSYLELFCLWFAIYFGIRYLVFELVIKITVHRGIFHSLLAVVFVALLTVNVSYYCLSKPARIAWNCGLFIGTGYLVHLSLDELYSVDLLGRRMKKSFGTALKLLNSDNLKVSLLMLGLVVALIIYAPPFKSYWGDLALAITNHDLKHKWLPAGNQWFKGIFIRSRIAVWQ